MHAGALRLCALTAGFTLALTACGSSPPAAASLLSQSSQRMLGLKGFHFQLGITGAPSSSVPVKSAVGDAHPPELRANVNLQEGGLVLEVQVVFAGGGVYLKSFTGGWQRLTEQQLAQFFDARTLFDHRLGLFAAMRDTAAPSLAGSQAISGHDTYPVSGTIAGSRVHQLLAPIRDQGRYNVTYWIENGSSYLWRARLSGDLFNPSSPSTVTFDFTKHDEPVSVTPPAAG